MNTIHFNAKFKILLGLLIFFLVEYIFLSLFFAEHNKVKRVLCTNNDLYDNGNKKELVKEKNSLIRENANCESLPEGNILGDNFVRDFYRYNCKSITRYGSTHTDPNYRIDGAYFVCNDGLLQPIHSKCIVLSFGVNTNDNFENEINEKLNCLVHSFDPFIEPPRIATIRAQDSALKDAVTVKIKENWHFHKMGITNGERIRDVRKQGWLDTYEHILEYVNLKGQMIDVFKLDAEGAEWESLPYIFDTNPGLLCDYVKQIAVETHSWLYNHTLNYQVVSRLEKCFRLFRRDQRFYISLGPTEWQLDSFNLDLKKYKDEVDLAKWLFTYGELYFVNIKFLN